MTTDIINKFMINIIKSMGMTQRNFTTFESCRVKFLLCPYIVSGPILQLQFWLRSPLKLFRTYERLCCREKFCPAVYLNYNIISK